MEANLLETLLTVEDAPSRHGPEEARETIRERTR